MNLACRKGNFEIIKILLNKNLNNINMTKSDKKTSLHLASITSSLCTQILLKNNANTNIIDNDKNKPSKLALIYGREDIFNMIDSENEKSILDFYNTINKYDNDKWNLNWKKDCNIKHLCRFMRKNDLKSALEISNLIFENREIMSIIKNDTNIQKKLIRNACKGILEDYLYILLKLIDLKTNSSFIFEYIYRYYLKNWIIVLEKNGIIFNKNISEQNYIILEYLLLNDEEEFINLMNTLEEIASQFLSRILFLKCINKIEIDNFENLFIKFRPKNINIESFSETSEITIEDIKYLLENKYKFNINFSTFNFEKMIKFCRPSVVKLILTNNEFIRS